MYRVMEPVFCEFTGKVVHYMRRGSAVKSFKTADAKLQKLLKRFVAAPAVPYIVDDKNIIVKFPQIGGLTEFTAQQLAA